MQFSSLVVILSGETRPTRDICVSNVFLIDRRHLHRHRLVTHCHLHRNQSHDMNSNTPWDMSTCCSQRIKMELPLQIFLLQLPMLWITTRLGLDNVLGDGLGRSHGSDWPHVLIGRTSQFCCIYLFNISAFLCSASVYSAFLCFCILGSTCRDIIDGWWAWPMPVTGPLIGRVSQRLFSVTNRPDWIWGDTVQLTRNRLCQ